MKHSKRARTRLSEIVVANNRKAGPIGDAALGSAEEVGVGLNAFFARGLPEGAELPDLVLTQVILGNIVLNDARTMVLADHAHFDAVSAVNKIRRERDYFSARLSPTLIRIRIDWDRAYGTNSCQQILGLGIEIPDDAIRLENLGSRIIRVLSADDFELPREVPQEAGIDPQVWLAEVKQSYDGLASKIDEFDAAKRVVERKLLAKQAAIETYETSFLRCTQILGAFYKASGHDGLAARLRQTVRRKHGRAEPAPEEGEGEPRGATGGEEPPVTGEQPGGQATPQAPSGSAGVAPDRPPVLQVAPDRPPTARAAPRVPPVGPPVPDHPTAEQVPPAQPAGQAAEPKPRPDIPPVERSPQATGPPPAEGS